MPDIHQPDPPAAGPWPTSCATLLQRMVQFDTINSDMAKRPDSERPMALWLEAAAGRLGLKTQRLPLSGPMVDHSFNLLITLPDFAPDDARPVILFESHMDTVSVDGMTIEPFGGKIEGGKLYGRGAADTKGSGAAMLWALAKFARQPNHPNHAALLFACGEESRRSGAKGFVNSHLSTLGWRPAGVIVGEPTQLRPVVAHNGTVRWTIHTQGVAAHSSDPSRGKSAITMMLRVVEAIESRYTPSLTATHPLTGKAQCSVNLIRGGTAINIIPERCAVEIDRRVVPGEEPAQVLAAVQKILDEVSVRNPGLKAWQDQPYIGPPLDPHGADQLIATVRAALRQLHMPDEPTGVFFGTDASTYSTAGIPAVVLGPGDIAQAHTHDEWIALEQLDHAVEQYLAIMNTPLSPTR